MRLCPPQHPQNKATDSVSLLQSCSFSSLSSRQVLGLPRSQEGVSLGAGVPDRASTRHVSKATETLPLLHVSKATETLPLLRLTSRGGFQGFF